MVRRVNSVVVLLEYVFMALGLIAAVEYFKYKTRISYEWFHCTPKFELLENSGSTYARKLWAVGGPSCDKRGELKTIMKRITMDYEPNDEEVHFCIVENAKVKSIHYPVEKDNKGEPGYYAFAGYKWDAKVIEETCELHGATVFHL